MMPDLFDERFVVHSNVCVEAHGTPEDRYFVPVSADDVNGVCSCLESMVDGTVIACRGRNLIAGPTWGSFIVEDVWAYGVCVLQKGRCFYLWDDGTLESWEIRQVDHRRLVHYALERGTAMIPSSRLPAPSRDKVVILSHGYSPERGPDYALIRALEVAAMRLGWTVVVPNFLDSYKFGSSRGRSERTKLIYEELLCLPHKPRLCVLVGHSQGGAASAVACTDRVVQAMNIQGLLLVGSEGAGRDGVLKRPIPSIVRILHSVNDGVVAFEELQRLGSHWGVPLLAAESAVARNSKDAWGDDVHHDFLSKDLMSLACEYLREFLRDCERVHQDPEANFSFFCSPEASVEFEPGWVAHIRSARGIGRVRIHVGPQVKSLTLRFHFHGLEKCFLDTGKQRLRIEVQSHGGGAVLEELHNLDSTTTQLSEADASWCPVDRHANDGFINVRLPPHSWIPSNEMSIDFVDFYR